MFPAKVHEAQYEICILNSKGKMWSLKGGSGVQKLNEDCGCQAHEWELSNNDSVLGFCEVGMELETTSDGLLQHRRARGGVNDANKMSLRRWVSGGRCKMNHVWIFFFICS